MAGPPARAHRSDARFPRRACLSICNPAPGLVVSMVDGTPAGNNFGLASRVAAARDQFRRWAALLLDGRHICSTPLFRSKTRLLFDEYVERVRAVGRHGLGSDSQS